MKNKTLFCFVIIGLILLSQSQIGITEFSGSLSDLDVYFDAPLPCSYLIDCNSTQSFRFNGTTWKIEQSSTNRSKPIQNGIENLTGGNGGLIFVKAGNYVDASVTVKNKVLLMLEAGVTGLTYSTTGTGIVHSYVNGYAVLEAPLNMSKNQIIFGVFHAGSARPSNPTEAQWFYDTDDHALFVWNNTAWVNCFSGGTGSTHIPEQEYSYLIRKSGSDYIMKNGSTEQDDWTSSDAEAIFEACIGNLSNGGLIYVKNADYRLSGEINMTQASDITIEGESWKAQLHLDSGVNRGVLNIACSDRIIIRNLYFNQNRAGQSSVHSHAQGVISIRSSHALDDFCDTVTVEKCKIVEGERYGIWVGLAGMDWTWYPLNTNIDILRNYVRDCNWDGIQVQRCNGFSISEKNAVTMCGDCGIATSGHIMHFDISNNLVWRIRGTGGSASSHTGIAPHSNYLIYDCTVSLNVVWDCKTHLYFQNIRDLTVTGNTLDNCSRQGYGYHILVIDIYNFTFSGNIISWGYNVSTGWGGTGGVYLNRSYSGGFYGNVITDVDMYAYKIQLSENITFCGGLIDDVEGADGFILIDCSDISIIGYRIRRCTGYGVNESGSTDYTLLDGSNLRGNGGNHTVDAGNSVVGDIIG